MREDSVMSDVHARVAELVVARMGELAMSQADVVRASKVSEATVRRLQTGVPWTYRAANLQKISLALGWPGGELERLLAGDAAAPPPDEIAELRARVADLEARVAVLETGRDEAPRP